MKRVFVKTPGSDEMWLYAGGPEPEDAMRGLANIIRPDVAAMLAGHDEPIDVQIEVREMSDEEVAALPDGY